MKTKQAKYTDYQGRKQWKVTHPAQKKSLTVTAPDRHSAMVAAAKVWSVRWQAIEFYDAVVVTPAATRKEAAS